MLSATNKTQNATPQTDPIGQSVISVINGTEMENKVKNTNNATLNVAAKEERSGIYGDTRTLPVNADHHNVFIYLKSNDEGTEGTAKKKKKKKKEYAKEEGIVIGPIDGPLPEEHHGNGPQEKETKDLHQGNIQPTKSPVNEMRKPKGARRPKRFTYDFNSNNNNVRRNSLYEPDINQLERLSGRSSLANELESPSRYPERSRSSSASSSYDNYFADQMKRAEMPSSNYFSSSTREKPNIGMYSTNPSSPNDAEITNLLKNDKDLQQLARLMPAGTKVMMNGDTQDTTANVNGVSIRGQVPELASRYEEQRPESRQLYDGYPRQVNEEQQQMDGLVEQYRKGNSEDSLYKLMEQQKVGQESTNYGETEMAGNRDGLSYGGQEYTGRRHKHNRGSRYGGHVEDLGQRAQSYGDETVASQVEKYRNYGGGDAGRRSYGGSSIQQLQEEQYQRQLQEQEQERQNQQEYYSPLRDQREETGLGRNQLQSLGDYSAGQTQAAQSEESYQSEEGGSEMNSFLNTRDSTRESNVGKYGGGSYEEYNQGQHKPASDISDRELISKLLDMLREKEHSNDVAQTESNYNFQHHMESNQFLPTPGSFSPYNPQEEFAGTSRSNFPEPSDHQSTYFENPKSQQPTPTQNILQSLIQSLSKSNNAPYYPPQQEERGFFQQPEPEPSFSNSFNAPPQSISVPTETAAKALGIPVINMPGLDFQRQQGVTMLMVKTPPNNFEEIDKKEAKKEKVEHKELTTDEGQRLLGNKKDKQPQDEKKREEQEKNDFSLTLKKAADFVLGNAVSSGNISLTQRAAIERKLTTLLEQKFKNKTQGEVKYALKRAKIPGACEDTIKDCFQFKEGGVCPFMKTFMKASCRKTCNDCSIGGGAFDEVKVDDFIKKSKQHVKQDIITDLPGALKSFQSTTVARTILHERKKKLNKIPEDPVMYLSFEKSNTKGVVVDQSKNNNNAQIMKGATISQHPLGTCGKVAEMNDGAIAWSGKTFTRKPKRAISILMWIKVNKSGLINWFANGKTGTKKFYTKTEGAVVPPKVWTHVAGTFDGIKGVARIYVNGDLEQEEQQAPIEKLESDWLENGIGSLFGDDSLRYVDEFYIYDRALKSNEVRSLFNRCVFNRMIFHYGFQKGNNSIIYDQSGLENNAIMKSGAKQKEDCGKCGYCLDLTQGPDPQLDIQRVPVRGLPTSKISITVWVMLNSTRGVHNIFTTESDKGNIGYRLQVIDGGVRFAIGTDIESVPEIIDMWSQNKILVPEGLWTHLTATYNNENGVGKIFVNGILKLEKIASPDKREDLPTNWDNEASVGDETFRGFLDEFVIYNWQLDENEVIYVRDYCADKPKLVRFTVRVPLTKKTLVPHGATTGKAIKSVTNHTDKASWWDLYNELLQRRIKRSRNLIAKRDMKTMHELEENPEKAAILLKKKK
eukprot:TCONS_00048354-protein